MRDIAASTASHPNVRDDRDTPLFSGWDGENKSQISEKQKRIIFRKRAGQEFATTARRANHLMEKSAEEAAAQLFLVFLRSFAPTKRRIVGWAKRRGWARALLPSLDACPPLVMMLCIMPRYIRAKIRGSVFFFTVVLAERQSDLLVAQIHRFRETYRLIRQRAPFETIAICILPDHLHAVWALPEGDADFSTRWSLIKSGFSRGLDPGARSPSKVRKREKGIWQRRYWEHAIRDDADLERHVDYVHFNPVKHGHVTRVADWPHGSFHR